MSIQFQFLKPCGIEIQPVPGNVKKVLNPCLLVIGSRPVLHPGQDWLIPRVQFGQLTSTTLCPVHCDHRAVEFKHCCLNVAPDWCCAQRLVWKWVWLVANFWNMYLFRLNTCLTVRHGIAMLRRHFVQNYLGSPRHSRREDWDRHSWSWSSSLMVVSSFPVKTLLPW